MNRKQSSILELSLYLFVGITLLVLPADFFDTSPAVCLSQAPFDRPCPGCGMTRACMHLIHLDVATAVNYHPLCVVVAPLLVGLTSWRCLQLIRRLGQGV